MSSPKILIDGKVIVYMRSGTVKKPTGEVEVMFYPDGGGTKHVYLDIAVKLQSDGNGGLVPVVSIEEKKKTGE